ncbi:hypothetical protein [Runella slithyformis]|uniref:Uncharacterized protein n=1 Tax=Runella slithyformis (strain ATCC 29530 / DSM 19594 / LMG 11500 / NCIMB 11436 / LSU 4) TaxID=761193 RepID=A0A7U4E8C1_RUNSL|nr:hypothetical protein [Runella slithyformis]AEI51104.1 hypothetical protein Runsl_4789 [Runella slithyformis DSM 19594]
MKSSPAFTLEVANFLRTLSADEPAVLPVMFPFPYFFFSAQRLVIHCISIRTEDKALTPEILGSISDACAGLDLKVIHLWEDVWHTKKAVVQSRLRALLGQTYRIPARLTQARRIDKPMLDTFLSVNHLQVSTTAKYKYGLFLPERYFRVLEKWPGKPDLLPNTPELLVAVASFSGAKKILRHAATYRSCELIRFANVLNATVVGGLDKLVSAFLKEVQADDIMTYADRDWSTGQSYERLGFERIGTTPPQAFWVNPITFEREYAFREAMFSNAVEIYNSGNLKYLLDLKKRPK